MHPRLRRYAHKASITLICALSIAAAGCHRASNTSYYGIGWTSVTAEPSANYASYVVTIDSVTLTRSDGVVVTAVGTPEVVDLAQLTHYSELWSSSAIPDGTYVSATIALDYTGALIAVMVDGKPQAAKAIYDVSTLAAATTYSVTVDFDPNNQPTITPTYASTSAVRLAIDFDLAASGFVDLTTATVFVRPVMSIALQANDTKLIRVRGPLINSSTDVDTYTVYLRPFYDEANNIGTLSLFSQPNTVYTINGKGYLGSAGLDALSVLSAGTTVTAGYTTFQTDYNPANGATAGKFDLVYVIGGSTLEDVYTEGITGDVIARDGNTLTLQGATVILNTADTFEYCPSTNCTPEYAQVLVGPGTIVTADDNTTLTGLTADSVSVGQHITARGLYSILSNNEVQIDARGSKTNTGSVRLQSTELWGSLVSSSTGSLVMDVQTINDWPVGDYNFAGNGAGTVSPAAFSVDTQAAPLPASAALGDPLWVDGFVTPFGSAPPDFDADAVNGESSVQLAGGQAGGGASTAPGALTCGIGSQVCDPAELQVTWVDTGIPTPLLNVSDAGFSLNLDSKYTNSASLRIGPESMPFESLPATLVVVPTTLVATSTFAPRYMVGVAATSTTTSTVTSTTEFHVYTSFASFISEFQQTLSASAQGLQFSAKGVYDRTNNTFTATSIDLVL